MVTTVAASHNPLIGLTPGAKASAETVGPQPVSRPIADPANPEFAAVVQDGRGHISSPDGSTPSEWEVRFGGKSSSGVASAPNLAADARAEAETALQIAVDTGQALHTTIEAAIVAKLGPGSDGTDAQGNAGTGTTADRLARQAAEQMQWRTPSK